MLIQIALIVMTAIVVTFVVAWMRSPQLRRTIEEPKYRIMEDSFREL